MAKRPNLSNPIGRSTPEWIGKTPDTPVPDHVKWRVLLRYDRKCAITGRPIRPGSGFECDHIIELIKGGENRESNLQPVLKEKHRDKTAKANAQKAKADAMGKKSVGITQPKQMIKSRGFPPSGKSRVPKTSLPPRALYEDVRVIERHGEAKRQPAAYHGTHLSGHRKP